MNRFATDRDALRKEMRAKRLRLSPETVKSRSAEILDRLRSLAAYRGASTILAYCPVGNEVDLTPLFPEIWNRGTSLLLPRCRPDEPGAMDLARVARPEDLASGAYGILEPDPAVCPALGDPALDLILVPGVVFDRRGFRLGFGGGYYDRLLAREGHGETVAVGLAYGFQVLDRIPDEPWDKPVHGICTDKEMMWIRR